MTEQDAKNLSIVSNYIEKCWGIREDDLAYLKQRIFNPVIAPEYKNFNFDENFRAIFEIDTVGFSDILSVNDKGWMYFNHFFTRANMNISFSYDEYLKNKKKVGKNELKIKKVLENWYKEHIEYFIRDVDTGVYSKQRSVLTEEDIEPYIIKAFEIIGIHKPKQNGLKLVISFNYADWLLCSTSESWSSCLNIDNGAFWKGLPTIFGDDNRALMYITTDGRKKDWQGIKVDSFIARAWVFLNNKGDKIISKFYPTEPISYTSIKEITKDKTFFYFTEKYDASYTSKYDLIPVRFKKDGIYITPYNDIVSIGRDLFNKEKVLRYHFGVKGGKQGFNFGHAGRSVSQKKSYFHSLHDYYKNGVTINSEFQATCCNKCNSVEQVIDLQEIGLCVNCITDDYGKCGHCGSYHLKKDLNKKIQGMLVCDECFKGTIICSLCGEREFLSAVKIAMIEGEEITYCTSCEKTKIAYCDKCGTAVIKGKNNYHKDGKHYCFTCVKSDEYLSSFKVCSDCRALLKEEEAIVDFFENYYCDPCLQKERDKKQIFFNFN